MLIFIIKNLYQCFVLCDIAAVLLLVDFYEAEF